MHAPLKSKAASAPEAKQGASSDRMGPSLETHRGSRIAREGEAFNEQPRVRQLKAVAAQLNRGQAPVDAPERENRTGLPKQLKSGIESLSGETLDDVRVHYNSARPAALGALAYAQGTQIHLGPGKERHLPHEAWHVVQQKQGRVRADRQFGGLPGNADPALEQEADRMGALALQTVGEGAARRRGVAAPAVQLYMEVNGHRIDYPERIAGSNYAHLLTALDHAFTQLGFTLSKEGAATVAEWCRDPGLMPRAFHDTADVVAALMSLGLSYSRRQVAGSTGPSTLGDRPNFTGDANKLQYGQKHGGTARRHVISSSTLGAAVEASQTTLAEINAFLQRHKQPAIVAKAGEEAAALLHARRSVWELVHNHVGNLWVGPSPINTAIGFIRATLNRLIHRLASSEQPLKIGEAAQLVIKPSGPMDRHAQAQWQNFAAILNSVLPSYADAKTGALDPMSTQELLLHFTRNADLDAPQHLSGEASAVYMPRLRAIYAETLGAIMTSNSIFTEGGTLDKFMALDAGTKVPADVDMDLGESAAASPAKVAKKSDKSDASSSSKEASESAKDSKSGDGQATTAKAATKADILKLHAIVPAHVGPNNAPVHNVSGDGMNCLIRSLLVAASANNDAYANGDPNNVVAETRHLLATYGFADGGEMLDLAGAAGAIVISRLVARGLIAEGRGITLYRRDANTGQIVSLPILGGGNPVLLWLSGNHFRAVR
jgi:hypothetical protein